MWYLERLTKSTMKKNSKKEIRQVVEKAMKQVLLLFEVSAPSRKIQKLLDSLSKKIAREVKASIKKKEKIAKKTPTPSKKVSRKVVRKKG
jgi:hypothetical protein